LLTYLYKEKKPCYYAKEDNKMDFKNKKGAIGVQSLGALAIVLMVAAIIIAVGAEILTDVQGEMSGASGYTCGTSGSAGFNATCGGLDGANTFGDWLDTIALIIVAAVVIGIIATSFGNN